VSRAEGERAGGGPERGRAPARLLASLAPADELVVVLDRSTDGSRSIASGALCRGGGARVLEGAWELEGERRNAGIAACTGDWILEVDADERVPPALWDAVRRVCADSPHGFHRVRIDNHVGDRLIRHGWGGSFGTTLKPALFRRGAKRWRAQRVHPGLDWTGTEGEPIEEAGIRHEVDRDISDMLRGWTATPPPRPRTCWRRATSAACRGTSAAPCRASASATWRARDGRKAAGGC
jgi:hypothetical protein